jgi:hypothetical protein
MEWPLHCHVCGLSDVNSGHCIALFVFRARKNDCGDWSHELNCTGTVTRVLHSNDDNNTATYFLLNFSCL